MTLDKRELLLDLKTWTTNHINQVKDFQKMSDKDLSYRSQEGRWTLLENIEHLNRYAEFYIPTIEQAITKSKPSNDKNFKSGWLGNKFAVSMFPGRSMTAMNTFKSKNPLGENLNRNILEIFLAYLDRLSIAIEKCEKLNLSKYTKITIPLLQIKLGDTLRVVIYHHERHMKQIEAIGL